MKITVQEQIKTTENLDCCGDASRPFEAPKR